MDSSVTGAAELTVRLLAPGDSAPLAATLRASGGSSSACRGRGGLRFSLAGILPDTLTLEIAAARATFRVLRAGSEIGAPVMLSEPTTVTIRLGGGWDRAPEDSN